VSIDPESGETLPDDATSPFPNPCETPIDIDAQAQSRVLMQYRESTKLRGTITDIAELFQALEDVGCQISTLRDIATATGVNLDDIGELVGVSRVLSSGTSLSDANYRLLIAQRILRNKAIGSGPEFVAALEYVFGATPFLFQDLGHMAVRLSIGTGAPPSADQLAILNSEVMPRAMAVGITRIWYDPANYFGFSDDVNADGFGEIGDPPPPGGKLAELFG